MGSLYFLCLPCCFRASLFKKIGARLLPSIDCLKRISTLSFIPLVPYPARFARHLPLKGKRDRATVDRVLSYNGALETISLNLFHPASPIQPPPLRGTSFHRKEGVSTLAPSLGRGCRAQRGGVGFLFWAAKPPPLCLPHWGKGTAQRRSGAFVNCLLETIFPLSFIPLPHLTAAPSGHLLP